MKGASVLFLLGLYTGWSQAIFLNHRPFPTYSLENMPQTSFSCREKILGGYYADVDTQCQMFHICVKVAGIGVQDFRFLCPNGTAFDQDHQICAEWEDIDCDATTLYYSSDNFDLYRIGSGFESKAVKYGEEEEPFALQRAETGDARINREQQARVVDQKKSPRLSNYNTARQDFKNQNSNNDKEIFKSSSSSNFYNNRNNGKERDEDYDDNVNVNQNQDYEQRRKVIRNKSRRPVQNNQNEYNRNNQNNQNENNRNTQQQNESNRNNQNSNRNQQNNEYNRNSNNNNNRNQNNDYNRNQNNDYNRNQNNDYNRNTDYNRNENDYNKNQNTDYTKTTQQPVAQTRRPASTKFTGFLNNFAGSYEPTTSRPTSTTLNTDQYTTAINNHKNRNPQRQRQHEYTDSPVYTISTPAPFKQQSQPQYNSPPVRTTNNNGQYYSSTSTPQKVTDTFAKKSTNYDENYDIPKIKPGSSTTQNYNTQYDIPKVKPVSSTSNGQYNNRQYDNQKSTTASQYETTKVKQNFNYKTPATDKTENYPSNNPKYSTSFDKKQTSPYKQNENYPTTLSPKPFSLNNNVNNNNNNNNNFPTTFAPRTNAVYNQIAQQTAAYNQNRQNNQNSQSTASSSTPRSTPFTQYTPTVPKLSSTTPVSRSSRFDETSYDDGSYSSKYDYDGDRRDDEFLKTAHSQNIAASRNELSRTTKQQQFQQQPQKSTYDVAKTTPFQQQQPQRSTFDTSKTTPFQQQQPQRSTYDASKTTQFQQQPQRTTYDVPKTFASTPKQATEAPKTNAQSDKKVPVNPPKKTKDVSYDYAYYDTNVNSEPDYEIDTEIKKSTVKN